MTLILPTLKGLTEIRKKKLYRSSVEWKFRTSYLKHSFLSPPLLPLPLQSSFKEVAIEFSERKIYLRIVVDKDKVEELRTCPIFLSVICDIQLSLSEEFKKEVVISISESSIKKQSFKNFLKSLKVYLYLEKKDESR